MTDNDTYQLLTESEVITGKSQTEALMYWPSVMYFAVMTERTRLISYLLHGMGAKEVIRLAFAMALFVFILKRYLYASFSFSHWKYSCTLSTIFVVSAHALVVFTHNSKEPWSWENFDNARSLQENLAHSAVNQSVHCSHIIKGCNFFSSKHACHLRRSWLSWMHVVWLRQFGSALLVIQSGEKNTQSSQESSRRFLILTAGVDKVCIPAHQVGAYLRFQEHEAWIGC